MTGTSPVLQDSPSFGHVCWVVEDDDAYLAGVRTLVRRARSRGDKVFLFGPKDSPALALLGSLPDVTVDPRLEFLDGGPLRPQVMFDMFERELSAARQAGYAGLAVVADMDWLLPLTPTTGDIVAFELLLDRRVKEMDTTVVCAYRAGSFDTAAIIGTRCVHPLEAGTKAPPPFRFLAAGPKSWRVSGDIDIAVVDSFTASLQAAVASAAPSTCMVDISEVEFIDAGGLRAIANTAARGPLELRGARRIVRRSWSVGRFADQAPTVRLAN